MLIDNYLLTNTRNVYVGRRGYNILLLDSLKSTDRSTKLKLSKSDRIYKFDGGERLKSAAETSMPAFIQGGCN